MVSGIRFKWSKIVSKYSYITSFVDITYTKNIFNMQ